MYREARIFQIQSRFFDCFAILLFLDITRAHVSSQARPDPDPSDTARCSPQFKSQFLVEVDCRSVLVGDQQLKVADRLQFRPICDFRNQCFSNSLLTMRWGNPHGNQTHNSGIIISNKVTHNTSRVLAVYRHVGHGSVARPMMRFLSPLLMCELRFFLLGGSKRTRGVLQGRQPYCSKVLSVFTCQSLKRYHVSPLGVRDRLVAL